MLQFLFLSFLFNILLGQAPDVTQFGYNSSVTFEDCNIVVSWRAVVPNSSLIELAMQAPTLGSVSIGFTSGGWKMVGSDAYNGYVTTGGVAVVDSLYLAGQVLSLVIPNSRSNVTDVSGFVSGSWTTIFFTRNGSDGYNPGGYNAQYTLIASWVDTKTLKQHTCYVRSTFIINFTQTTEPDPGPGVNQNARIAHGVIMGVAFTLILPLAITIARFGKRALPKNWWFYCHAILQSTFFIFVLAGAILGYAMVGDYLHFTTWHGPLGTTIWILVWLQFASGLLRPNVAEEGEKKSPIRIGWEWIHAWLGRIIFLMAGAQIVAGIMDLNVPNWAYALWAPFYGFWFIIAIPLEIARIIYESKRKKNKGGKETAMTGGTG